MPPTPPDDRLPSHAEPGLDAAHNDRLGGSTVFGVIAAAIAGAAACGLSVSTSPLFGVAVDRSPLFLVWLILLTSNGAISWAGFFGGLDACVRSCSTLWRGPRQHLPWIFAAVSLLILVLVVALLLERGALSDVRWPLAAEHQVRLGIATGAILIPPLVAIAGMWLTAVQAFEALAHEQLSRTDVGLYLQRRERVQGLLWYAGTVVGAGVLTTGALRRAMIEGNYAQDPAFPQPLVLAYGTVFTVLLIVSYVPPFLMLQSCGSRLVAHFATGNDLAEWSESRKKLSDAFQVSLGLQDSIKNALAILAPLVAGLISTAMPKG